MDEWLQFLLTEDSEIESLCFSVNLRMMLFKVVFYVAREEDSEFRSKYSVNKLFFVSYAVNL